VRVLAQNLPVLASTRTRQNGVFQKYARLTRIADNWQTILSRLAKLVNRVRVLAHSRVLAKKKLFACIQLSSDIGKDPNLVVIGQAI
jgi:hypothetical protein